MLKGQGRTAFVLFLLALASQDVAAQGRDIRITSFDVRIEVGQDASIDVTESLHIRFDGSWNGIERDILLDHETGTGRRTLLSFELQSVTDDGGVPLRFEDTAITNGRRLRIWVPQAENATRVVRIRYRVPDAIRFFGERHPTGSHDELYWDVTGNLWEMPIDSVSTSISLPSAVEDVEAWAYTGQVSSEEAAASISIAGDEVRFETQRSLAPREGLTVSVTWAPGVIVRPGPVTAAADVVWRWWPLTVSVLAFFTMIRFWKREGKDPEERAITVQYEPPAGLSAVQAGTIVDHGVQMHDITSMLVDLAVRGYVTIEEREEKKLLGLVSDTEYWFHMRRPRADWKGLATYERRFLEGLFTNASTTKTAGTSAASRNGLSSVKLSDLQNRFYRSLEGIKSAVYESLIVRGLYAKRPDSARNRWVVMGLVVGAATIPGAAWVSDHPQFGDPLMIAIGFGAAALIVILFGVFMPARTEAGARALEAALGFREFLQRVEQDRFQRMITSPELFERYLPFAMAFRVEERWAKAFNDLYRTPPEWYQGRPGTTFTTTGFTRSMSTMSTEAGRSMASSPKSSSGSGGGGFSGGGSGGGGGRGF